MTEAEWLACQDPTAMVEFLHGRVSDRKLRLLACANCRSVWQWITDERSRVAVAVAERVSDGLASQAELANAIKASYDAATLNEYEDPDDETVYLRSMSAAYANHSVWGEAFVAALANSPSIMPELTGLPETLPLHFVRDIFGNPFRPVTFSPEWRTDTAVALARQMYDAREFSAMPILADALQDAGCDNDDVLNHCCGEGTHVRGCWVVDLVLGKE